MVSASKIPSSDTHAETISFLTLFWVISRYRVAGDWKFIGQAEVTVHVRVDEPGDLDDASAA
jgi:hypothetical protein